MSDIMWPHDDRTPCPECKNLFHESEMNGHLCVVEYSGTPPLPRIYTNYDNFIKEQGYMKVEGVKHDQEKPDLSLVPGEFSAEVARGFMYGATKYGRYNYLNGMDWHRVIAAVKRHVDAFQEGEDNDPESGVSHLGHAACGLAMLLVYNKRGIGTDTRHKSKKLGKE